MDFSKLATKVEGHVALQLRHPDTGTLLTNDDKPINVFVRSPDHAEVKKVDKRIAQKRIEAVQNNRNKMRLDVDELEAEAVEKLISHIAGWEGIFMGEDEFKYTPENVKFMLTDPSFAWVREQVDTFAGERGNFLKKESMH